MATLSRSNRARKAYRTAIPLKPGFDIIDLTGIGSALEPGNFMSQIELDLRGLGDLGAFTDDLMEGALTGFGTWIKGLIKGGIRQAGAGIDSIQHWNNKMNDALATAESKNPNRDNSNAGQNKTPQGQGDPGAGKQAPKKDEKEKEDKDKKEKEGEGEDDDEKDEDEDKKDIIPWDMFIERGLNNIQDLIGPNNNRIGLEQKAILKNFVDQLRRARF